MIVKRTYFYLSACLVLLAATGLMALKTAGATPSIEQMMGFPDDTDIKAPVDYGAGPGVKPQAKRTKALTTLRSGVAAPSSNAIPSGDAAAGSAGIFGAPVTWPVIPIHVILLPDGQVMSYGTTATGQQGAQLIYDVWNPSLGTDASAHVVLPNSTSTDIFCGAQSLMLSGDVLTSGGDLTVNGVRNSATNQTTIFSSSANSLTANTAMNYARWYATLVGLPNGQLGVFGGRQNVGPLSPVVSAPTPEIYDPALRNWTSLTGATSTAAFGANWWYPRVFVAPGGAMFVINSTNGKLFYLSTANGGSITASGVTAPVGDISLPTVPFAPGKLLSVRLNQQVVVVDYTASTPTVTQTDPIDQVRYWANGTVLADGRVLVTGGSADRSGTASKLTGVDYRAQIWDPRSGHWTSGASALKPRLYHSTAMLLADATVLTGGGGAPGPVNNLNAEIYYPPYLYAADGSPAMRPIIASTSAHFYDPGSTLIATLGQSDVIGRLTLIRAGSATHSNNADQRFIELNFTQVGQTLSAILPSDTSVLVPGFYMLFAIDSAGVPSIASLVNITANGPVSANFAVSPVTVAFGTTQVGVASVSQAVTVTNNGATLPLSKINFTGPGASQFSQTNSCGAPVAPGSACTINIVFTPTVAGYTYATLNVTGLGLTHTVKVNGTGSVPFAVSPATVPFGTVPVNTTSESRAISVANTGGAPLPVTNITLSGGGASQFSQTNTCATPVPVGSSCTITVIFMPTSPGYLWAKVNVNAPGSAHTSTVNGTGGAVP